MANYSMISSRILFHNTSFGAAFISVTFVSTVVEASFTPFVGYQADGNAVSALPRIPNTAPRSEAKAFSDHDYDEGFNTSVGLSLESPTLDAPVATEGGSSVASAHALAYASIGDIKLELSGLAQQRVSQKSQGGEAKVDSFVYGGWEDEWTFSTPNPRIGRAVLINGYIRLHGSLSGSATSSLVISNSNTFSSTRVGFDLVLHTGLTDDPLAPTIATGDGHYHAAFRTSSNPTHAGYNYPIPPLIPYSILVVEGQTYTFELQANLRAYASAKVNSYTGPGSLTALFFGELGNTIRWGGVESVIEFSTGQPIDDWTITSESGFDYSQPYEVPEPSSFILVAACLSIWSAWRRRRIELVQN